MLHNKKKRERKEKLSYSHFIFGSFEDFGHAGSEKFILHVPNLLEQTRIDRYVSDCVAQHQLNGWVRP
ncbi:hypothetical protein PPL_11646 [Heterostelium album PN500]|uniref:Uncharacterized protein n=1 Tax=Heterostelium pallidum (strain ATCC 26659 / Pp 5 / PN500) TaxID=670386 RepID=D3BVC0_HETP5|nr:hypothetical protein PPL_11646 [Heterostelium album PN500]EFA74677.1 hypothetical protein PPL_11646 [Heterostelium album PN500]|eukprot:XP_020426811.1 hypothetical protein PPL_11646 [Heterostelium album PN500]